MPRHGFGRKKFDPELNELERKQDLTAEGSGVCLIRTAIGSWSDLQLWG